MSGQTVLVTGGAGYIGSHTCKALAASGRTAVIVDNFSEGHRDFVQWGELFNCDVRDTAELSRIMQKAKPSAVIHFAASAYVGESVQNPQKYYDNNISGVQSVLEAMRTTGCRQLVFSSTCAVYGMPQSLPITLETMTEPISPYGRSKLMAEQMIHDCARAYESNAVILRYFNAAGADQDGDIGERHNPEPHLIPNIISAALGLTGNVQVFGDDYATPDGTCIRDYVHVSDLAEAHVSSLAYLDKHAGVSTFNLGSGKGISIKEIIDAVEHEARIKVPFDVSPRRAGDPAALYADIAHTEAELGWTPKMSSVQSIIRTALSWAENENKR